MVTVLIAVYNSAQWIAQCLDSLKAQTYSDFEAIVVDDCSTDESGDIIDRYAAEDARFRAIHLNTNGGQAKARNIALREARGEWVTMLDSDDWLSADALQRAMERSEDADCVLLNCVLKYADGREGSLPLHKQEWTPQEAVRDAIAWQGIHGLYVIKTDIHRRYPYDETTMLYSDDNTARQHFLHCRRIVACEGIYYYRQHSNSTTHVISLRHFDVLAALASLQHTFDDEPLATEEVKQALINHRWYSLTDMWYYYYTNKNAFRAEKKIIEDILRLSYKELIAMPVTSPIRHRLGYLRLRPYWLYVAQVKLYFMLKNVKTV